MLGPWSRSLTAWWTSAPSCCAWPVVQAGPQRATQRTARRLASGPRLPSSSWPGPISAPPRAPSRWQGSRARGGRVRCRLPPGMPRRRRAPVERPEPPARTVLCHRRTRSSLTLTKEPVPRRRTQRSSGQPENQAAPTLGFCLHRWLSLRPNSNCESPLPRINNGTKYQKAGNE